MPSVGFMAHFVRALSMIAYADRKAMMPVIDMKTSRSVYIYDYEVGKVNAWEYYFEQPGEISLDEALARKDSIIIPPSFNTYSRPNSSLGFYYDYGGELSYWRDICRKYIRLSAPLRERLEREKQAFSGKRVLGVSVRGTDYTAFRNTNHPVQPSAEQVIAKVQEVMSAKNFNAIYLSTEDKNIVAKFMSHFGDSILLPEQEYVNFDPILRKDISNYSGNRENDRYLSGLEYLTSKLLLCECDGLVTSMSGGAICAMLFSEGFDYLHVFDLGVYP